MNRDEEDFWKSVWNKWDIKIEDDNSDDESDNSDELLDFFDLEIEDEFLIHPTPEGFVGAISDCCFEEIVLMWNINTEEYIGVCASCNKEIIRLKSIKLVIDKIKEWNY